MSFEEAYNIYYNPETDDKYGKSKEEVDFSHKLYTELMEKPITAKGEVAPGLISRRKSEWILFQTGYMDIIGKWVAPRDILSVADELHRQQMHWYYYSDSRTKGSLYDYDIEASINNPGEVTCCATYVSSTLYLAGYVSEEEINKIKYNSSTSLYGLLDEQKKWTQITSYQDVEPGDIVFFAKNLTGTIWDHVEIYAGDNTLYSAGSTDNIQKPAPRAWGNWYNSTYFKRWIALRPSN